MLVACLLASFLQSTFFAYALVTDADEGAYMLLGRLAITGKIGLFQDEMTGQRMPLPYYVIGLSQLLFGRSLVAARFTSAALGLACLVLVYLLGQRLGGEVAGVLALLFAATQSVIIGYFAGAYYHSLVSLELLVALYVLLATDLRHRRVITMGCVALLFFTRPNVAPLISLACLYLVWESKRLGERFAIVAVTVAPPLVFFASDPNHLKLLAYVPGLSPLVVPLGFHAASIPNETTSERALAYPLTLFVRWYKPWILSALVLSAIVVVAAGRGRIPRRIIAPRGVVAIALTVVYLALWQLATFPSVRIAVGYFQSFAILAAIVLGFAFSRFLSAASSVQPHGALGAAFLAAIFLVSPSWARPPALPAAVSRATSPALAVNRLADQFRALIPAGSTVFLFGPSQALYLARREPYLRQVTHLYTLTTIADARIRTRSGLWGESEIHEWLGRDADYAVVVPTYLDAFRPEQNTRDGNNVDLIESLLARYFTRIDVSDDRSGITYHVYKRTLAGRSP